MSLLTDLAAYQSADAEEMEHRDAIAELVESSANPYSRRQFVPGHVTASAFIIDRASRRLLLHHHRRLDRWLQMGGHVEPGESLREAALREAHEESGLADLRLVHEAPFDLHIHEIPAAKGEPAHNHFDVRFLLETTEPDSIARSIEESLDLAWVPLEDAPALMNEDCSTRAVGKIVALLDTILLCRPKS